jgi:hypothetical protein
MNYTFYNTQTGEITGSGATNDIDSITPNPGDAVYLGQALDFYGFWFEDGNPITYTPTQSAAKRNRPPYIAAWNNQTMAWVDQRTVNQVWDSVRSQRNILLQWCDWTDTVSAQTRLTPEYLTQWQTYRQALRDVTKQTDPYNIVWPVPPA